MKISYTSSCGLTRILFLATLFFTSISQAQVGIGNIDPAASSMLDITSTEKGLLVPRLTSVQRLAISEPANSLMVYDTTVKSFYFYDGSTTAWVKINSSANERNNYKLIKSVADLAPELAAGGGTKYLLTSNTYYEINGLIALAAPIDLNDAYVSGLDANEDILFRSSGPVFQGTTGGSIRYVTLTGGGSAFNITGGTSLLVQSTIVANFASVGTISNVGLYFGNIVQFVNNTNGITYTSIGNLLLNNQAWLSDNGGTFETFTGTFGLIGKVSGFSTVGAGATGINVSSNPIVGVGTLLSTLFSGAGTYVNKYTTGSYPGYNFTNAWTVGCPGIPRESDDTATGSIYFNGTLATGFAQTVPTGQNVAFNLDGNTTTLASGNSRVTSPANNRLTYQGTKLRPFLINANVAVRANTANTTNLFFSFFFRKNGSTTLVPTNTVIRSPGAAGTGSDIINFSISGTVELAPGEYIEIWGQRLTGGTLTAPELAFFAVNMSMK